MNPLSSTALGVAYHFVLEHPLVLRGDTFVGKNFLMFLQIQPFDSEIRVALLTSYVEFLMLSFVSPSSPFSRALIRTDIEAPVKQCPVCRIYIERNEGCAQMMCKNCKHTFCWYCLQNLDVSDVWKRLSGLSFYPPFFNICCNQNST